MPKRLIVDSHSIASSEIKTKVVGKVERSYLLPWGAASLVLAAPLLSPSVSRFAYLL